MASRFNQPLKIQEIKGIDEDDEVDAGIVNILQPARNIMLVTHLPFLNDLISYLVIGRTDKIIVEFQRGGIVCIDKDHADELWHIKWALMPDMK